jgi:hypothetical protein
MKFSISVLGTLCMLARTGALVVATEEEEEERTQTMLRGLKAKGSKGGGAKGAKAAKKEAKMGGKKEGAKKGGAAPTSSIITTTRTFTGTVRVTNLAPELGTCQTPVWVGIHDGTFDIYDRDVAASDELEAIAEDGNAAPLSAAFDNADGTVWDDIVFGPDMPPVICPGQSGMVDFTIQVTSGTPLYFSYATMVIPSNDAFLANGNPRAFLIFNGDSVPSLVDFTDVGSDVLDAGTEVNDEVRANTAFFGQTVDNTGTPEDSVVTSPHLGFNGVGTDGILDDPRFINADFTADGYELIRVEVIIDA